MHWQRPFPWLYSAVDHELVKLRFPHPCLQQVHDTVHLKWLILKAITYGECTVLKAMFQQWTNEPDPYGRSRASMRQEAAALCDPKFGWERSSASVSACITAGS